MQMCRYWAGGQPNRTAELSRLHLFGESMSNNIFSKELIPEYKTPILFREIIREVSVPECVWVEVDVLVEDQSEKLRIPQCI